MDTKKRDEKWINLANVAEHLSVSQNPIKNRIKSGKIPFYKAGNLTI